MTQSNKEVRFQIVDGNYGINPETSLEKENLAIHLNQCSKLLSSIPCFNKFLNAVIRARTRYNVRGLEKILYQLASTSPMLKSKLLDHLEKAIIAYGENISPRRKELILSLTQSLYNLGIGEIVFVSAEGPNAKAGGLSQVVTGLSSAFNQSCLSTTVILPLYDEENGKQHKKAKDFILKGVPFDGVTLALNKLGSITVNFGPTYKSGTDEILSKNFHRHVDVYEATYEHVRFFFLHCPKIAKIIYSEKSAKEMLSFAIFLARGALELMKDPMYSIDPDTIITNDWHSALVPVLLKTDRVYSRHDRFQSAKTIHILHNCGLNYQGRFMVNEYGEDLWPMLNLHPNHFFGFAERKDFSFFNLTKAAIFHVSSGIITVSKPYAEELLNPNNGEGLQESLSSRLGIVYGISNGIDVEYIRKRIWEISGMSDLNSRSSQYTPERFIKNICIIKRNLKKEVQELYGLNTDKMSVLLSMVGRLSEQKGIQLFGEKRSYSSHQLVEDLLCQNSLIQFLFVGPLEKSSLLAESFSNMIDDLSIKYPGRVSGLWKFVDHEDALKIQAASDLFLMPSRYEPGGITQLESLAFGTPVVARRIGGIKATLKQWRDRDAEGNSFNFLEYSASALYESIIEAVEVLSDREMKEKITFNAVSSNHDWSTRLNAYLSILQKATGALDDLGMKHLTKRRRLVRTLHPFNAL